MMFALLSMAHAGDLWDRCVEEHRLPSVYADQGRALQRLALKAPENALEGLKDLEVYGSQCPTLFMTQAGIAHGQGRNAEARDALETAESLGAWPEVLRAIAIAYARAGDPSRLAEAVQTNPNDGPLRMRWITSLSPSAQAPMLREAIQRHREDPQTLIHALTMLSQGGRRLEAIERGQEAVARLDDPELHATVEGLLAPHSKPDAPRPRLPGEIRILDDGTEEITVYSPTRARQALTKRLHDLGWTEESQVAGGTRYRSLATVKPWVIIYDDGRVKVQERGTVNTTKRKNTARLGYSGIDLGEAPNGKYGGVTLGSNVISKRKLRAKRAKLMEDIWLEVSTWRQARDRIVVQNQLDATLPTQLTNLWNDGVPLYGDMPLTTRAERRNAILDHWASRGCSEAGDAARTIIARFVELEINDSATPTTPEEIQRAEQNNRCGHAWTH